MVLCSRPCILNSIIVIYGIRMNGGYACFEGLWVFAESGLIIAVACVFSPFLVGQ